MCHDDDGIFAFQLDGEILDLGSGNRIQCRRRLIHQNHLRLHRKGPCNAQSLLLSAGKSQSTFVKSVLQLIPDGCLTKASLHDLIQLRFAADSVDSRTVSYVLINTLRERIRLLEYHSNSLSQLNGIHFLIKIHAVQLHITLNANALFQIIHPVQCLQKR